MCPEVKIRDILLSDRVRPGPLFYSKKGLLSFDIHDKLSIVAVLLSMRISYLW